MGFELGSNGDTLNASSAGSDTVVVTGGTSLLRVAWSGSSVSALSMSHVTGIPRRLVQGVDVTWRAAIRIGRATQRMSELQGLIAAWNFSGNAYAEPQVLEGSSIIRYVLRIRSEPPIEEWAAVFGEALHDLRAAFDITAWEFCSLDGGQPVKPKQVYFPVCEEPRDWAEWERKLASMPAELLQRVQSMQPIQNPDPERNLLGMLHELNRLDKHRGVMEASAAVARIGIAGVFDVPANTPGLIEYVQTPIPFEDGAVLATITFANPIEVYDLPPCDAGVIAMVRREAGGDLQSVIELGHLMVDMSHRFHEYLYTGYVSADDNLTITDEAGLIKA